MTMRVTDAAASYASLAGLQSAASRLASLQAQLSSGKQITTPSDNPSGTAQALELRAEVKRNTQYTANANDAQGWLSTADSTYSQIVSLTQNARTLVVQGLNTGTGTSGSADAIADQIDGIRTSLINLSNTTYNGRPIFGGTTAGTAAYDSSGNYLGDAGTVSRSVGPQATLQINQTGTQVFGSPGSDLFSLLSNISATLRSNPSALGTDLTSLDTAIQGVSSAQASAGAAYQRVTAAQTAQTATSLSLQTSLSSIQDIDLANMAVQVSTANVNYQAALQTTASIKQMSLLNFLQ